MRAIDLFAGLGGFSLGARMAGIEVVWAANHWASAVQFHAANHPGTVHACQDLHQADWYALPGFDIALASPACQGHSRARGKDLPKHDADRATALAVVAMAEAKRPMAIVVENVPEFRDWPMFAWWLDGFKRLGYSHSMMVLDAADHGVPQHRERLFIVFTLSQSPLQIERWLASQDRIAFRRIQSATPAMTPVRGLCRNTRERVKAGRKVHGDEFLVAYYGNEKGGRSLDRPIGTITTHDRWALVQGDRLRMIEVDEARAAMGFPKDYKLPSQKRLAMHLLGNAVPPPLAAEVLDAVRGTL